MNLHRKIRPSYGLTLHIVEKGVGSKDGPRGDETVAAIGTDIQFDLSTLNTYYYDRWKPIHHDLLVVCSAVEFADRRCGRHAKRSSRWFQITLPVLDLSAWKRPEVRAHLIDVLRHLTGDEWHFSFVQSANSPVSDMRQRTLPFPSSKEFVIPYSNGLDSRCVSGIFDTGDSVVRVRLTKTKDSLRYGERPFDRIPFTVSIASSRVSCVRSRGFKFAAIAAIAGHLSGVQKIIMPESGQGALGPVLLQLYNIYADYRNHPTFFRKMERFIEVLLEYSVSYEQPRLWYTKGETIGTFLAQSGTKRESLYSTRSCWQQRWNARLDGKLRQCGLCAACLLRRMSMHAADVDEPSDTYTIGVLTAPRYEDAIPRSKCTRLSGTMLEYGIVGARFLQRLAEMAKLPDSGLRPHVFEIARATGLSEQDTGKALRRLLQQHAEEWLNFLSAQGQRSFIRSWTKRIRHGQSE